MWISVHIYTDICNVFNPESKTGMPMVQYCPRMDESKQKAMGDIHGEDNEKKNNNVCNITNTGQGLESR